MKPRHIVAIVLAACAAALLTPAAVGAATGSFFNLVDPVNGANKARVSNRGQVYVTEADPYNGQFARVDTAGKQLVGDGTGALDVVDAMPAVPLDTINDLTVTSADPRRPMFSGVGFRKVSLTSFIASAEGPNAGSVELLVVAHVKTNATTGSCEELVGFGAAERFTVMVPVGETVNLTWPTGLHWTQYADSNDRYCVNVESLGGPTGYTAHVSAYGYRH